MRNNFTRIMSLVLCLILVLPISAFAQESIDDYSKHWAGNQIKSFLDKGFITVDKDGNFKPNDPITRGDFVIIANKAFGFTEKAETNFKDVNANENYYNDILIAKKAGYIVGLPDGTVMPKGYMSRQEYALIISRLLKLDTTKFIEETNNFKDAAAIPNWSKGAIGAVAKAGYMQGETGMVFNPKGFITRGEAIAVLERCYLDNVKVAYNEPGTYSANVIEGNAAINVRDVKLENTTITGNLIIGEGVGDGTVKLRNIIVKGDIIVKGGGLNSIIIEDSQIKNIIIIKEDNKVRIVAVGTTTVERVDMQSGGKLEEQGTTGTGFSYVTLAENIDLNEPIILMGNFDSVQILSDGVKLDVTSGSVTKLDVAATASNTQINLGTGVKVTELIVSAKSEVTGTGTIGTAQVNVQETVITVPTTTTNTAAGVTVATSLPIPTPAPTPAPTPTPPPSGGSSHDDDDDDINVSTITVIGTGNVSTITTYNGTLQMLAAVTPTSATNKIVTWSVTNGTGSATISNTGLLTAVANGTVIVKATAKDGSGKFGTKEITISVPEAKGTIERAVSSNGGDNVTVNIEGQSIIFNGEIEYYIADESNSLPISGNWVGVKITAPEGVMPDENAVLTVNDINCNIDGIPGWDNIKEEGDGDNYFHLYQRVREIPKVNNIVMKWNNESTERYFINLASTSTLEVFRTDLENMILGAQENYDNAADYGTISAEAIDALGTAIDTAQAVYDEAVDAKTEAVQAGIYTAQDELIAAMDAFWDAYETEIVTVSDNIAANKEYTDADPLNLSIIINGIGDFVTGDTDYITLGGTLATMDTISIEFEGVPANRAILKLTGTTGASSIYDGAITIAEGGVNGHIHGFNSAVVPIGTIERVETIGDEENAAATIDGQMIRFYGEIGYYEADESNGLPESGNYVGVKITAHEGVIPDENAVLTEYGDIHTDGWSNIKKTGDGDNYFHFYQRVPQKGFVYEVKIKWNNNITETYLILIPGKDATLEVSKTDL